jgi:tetratricopeptide (TPR) repeat protein
VVAVAGLALVAETASVYPHQLAFFNRLVGGPANGHEYLLDSNLSWGQGLKPLKAWMNESGVNHVNLAYFGQADPSYYGIDCTHLPGAPSFAIDSIARPKLPGYVAISETTLHGVYSPPEWRLFYAGFREMMPVAVIDHAIRVYWVEEWPEASVEPDGVGQMAHRALGDALLFGLKWPLHAERHYRQYMATAPGDADASTNYGIALMAAGQIHQGVDALHAAVEADGDNSRARLILARALFANQDPAGAVPHAERAVALRQRDPDALLLLGRLYAAQRRFDSAARAFEAARALRPDDDEARQLLRRLGEEGWRGGEARAR